MAGGFEVVPVSVGKAADHAHRAAEAVRPIDASGPLSGIVTGMPGGTSAAAAARLADEWGQAIPRWAADAGAHGDRLDDAVRTYQRGQESAANTLGAAGR